MKVVKSLIFILFALCSLSGKAQEVAADSTGYIVRVGNVLVKCMESGGEPFCVRAHLGADISIEDHWVH